MGKKPTADPPRPWYADGLRFECQPDCGACCTNHDDYAYVYLVGDDLERLARQLNLPVEEVKERYTELDDGNLVLRMDEVDCPFLEGTRCSVYDARPKQCLTFPFWKDNLKSPRHWKRLETFCPGIGRGEVQKLPVIQSYLVRHADED